MAQSQIYISPVLESTYISQLLVPGVLGAPVPHSKLLEPQGPPQPLEPSIATVAQLGSFT